MEQETQTNYKRSTQIQTMIDLKLELTRMNKNKNKK